MTKKTKNNAKQLKQEDSDYQLDFDQIEASLNFAFCPTFPLRVNTKTKEESGFFNSSSSKNDKIIDSLLDISRHFYICYSFKFADQKQDYFFFQSFSIAGFEIFHSEPVFGFFSKEQILTLISQIDEMFLPQRHEKQIYDSYISDTTAAASYLLAIMGEWTKLKLEDFEYFYFTSDEVALQIQQLTEQLKSAEAPKRKKTNSKTQTRNKVKKDGAKSKPATRKPTGTKKSTDSSK